MGGAEICLVAVLVALFASGILLGRTGTLNQLHAWATENNYRIVQYEHRYFHKGPFKWHDGIVYRIVAQDQEGNTRGGWVELGGIADFFSRINVRWDPESTGFSYD